MNFFGECSTNRQRELTAAIFRTYGQRGCCSTFFSDNITNGAPAERLRRLEPALQIDGARAEGYAEYCQQVAEGPLRRQ